MNPADSNNKPLALTPPPATGVGDSNLIHSGFLVPAAVNPSGGPGQHAPGTAPPTMSGLLQALRRRWPLALGLAVVAAALAVGAVFTLMPPKYPVMVRLLIASRGDVRVFGEGNDEPDFLLYKKNIEAMVKSPAVLAAALNQKTKHGKDVKDLQIIQDNGVEWLEFALKTDFLLGPEILKVVLNTERPEEGTEVVNAIASAFVDDNIKKDNERRDKRLKDFRDNLRKQEEELNGLRVQLRNREKGLEIPDETIRKAQTDALLQQQIVTSKAVSDNRTEQIKARQKLASAQETLKRIDQLAITAAAVDEFFVKDFRAQELLLESKKIEKEIVDTQANGQPQFIANHIRGLEQKKQNLTQRVAALKEQLRPEYEANWRNKYADDMQSKIYLYQDELSSLEKQEPNLKDELAKIEKLAKAAPASQLPLEIVNLQNKINNLEFSVGEISKTIQKMVAEVVNPRVSILQWAAEPRNKDYSRQIKVAGVGGFGMFLLALFGVAFLEFRSGRISGAAEVSQTLGMNIVGSLPPMPLSARKAGANGASAPNVLWQNQLTEAIDGIRTLLLHSARTDNLRVIMITSACSGEGKTSLATQLAASLARAWRKTLLIDGDLRKPAAHKVFNVPQEPGFSELLRNEVSVNDAVKPTALGRLWVMPAGNFDSHAVQALAQDNLRTLLEQFKQQYDFIIIDSCPVLPVADALLLGQHVDGVVFSILRDVSRVPAVYAAQQKIHNLGIRTLGAVMIGAKSEAGSRGYAYGGSKNA